MPHLPVGLCKEASPLIKFAYRDWLTCKKRLLGGHGKVRRTVTQNDGKRTLLQKCRLDSRFRLSVWQFYHKMMENALCNEKGRLSSGFQVTIMSKAVFNTK